MADGFADPRIETHIRSISARSDPATSQLISTMLRRCWPGGASDRSESAALEWVRRWGPRRIAPPVPTCSCAAGRCQVCN